MHGRKERQDIQIDRLTRDDVIRDGALHLGEADEFEHGAIARIIADLANAAEPPVNIAVFGPWGSGKSSLFEPIMQSLKAHDRKTSVARYDAWKFGGQSLKRNFVSSLRDDLKLGEDETASLTADTEKHDWKLIPWLRKNSKSLAAGYGLAVAIAAVSGLLLFLAQRFLADQTTQRALLASLGPTGTILGLAIAAVVIGPKALESASARIVLPRPQADDEFVGHFTRLVEKATKDYRHRLVVFIDELDRCEPRDVVSTLVDLKTFLDHRGCVFIVAADREVLEKALEHAPQASPIRTEDPYYSTPGEFLDKIFQHQLTLPPLRPQALTRFARTLVADKGGVWADLRDSGTTTIDGTLLETVVYALIPAHVRSPRRVKVLLNNFATNARTAEARGIDWRSRATEIAKLTAIQTEFPRVASALLRDSGLLTALLDGPPQGASRDLLALVDAFSEGDQYGPSETTTVADEAEEPGLDATPGVAGPLLVRDPKDARARGEAEATLRIQLREYLRKVRAAGIPDPDPDLLYLQSAGTGYGLSDPRLERVIDFASDTDPATVVEAFDGRDPDELLVASRLLADRADDEAGPGRANLVESACRLAELVPTDRLAGTSQRLAPSVYMATSVSGFSREEALPGALLVAGLAGHRDLTDLALRALQSIPARILERTTTGMQVLESPSRARLASIWAERADSEPEPLAVGLRTLPAPVAAEVWGTVAKSLERRWPTGDAEEATEPPVTSSAARRARPAVTSDDEVTNEESTRALQASALATILRSTTEREERSDELVALVTHFALAFGRGDFYNAVRHLGDSLLGDLDPVTARGIAVTALKFAPASDWSWWARYLDNTPQQDDPRASEALAAVISHIAGATALETATGVRLCAALMAADLQDAALERVASALVNTLSMISWTPDAPAAAQRKALYQIARPLNPAVAIAEAIETDFGRALSTAALDDEMTAFLLELISACLPDGARRILAALSAYQPTTGEAASVARLEIAARQGAGVEPLGWEQITPHVSGTNGGDLFESWVQSMPPLAEVLASLEYVDLLQPSTIGAYAEQSTLADRTALWIALLEQKAANRYLERVGRSPISTSAVAAVRRLVADEGDYRPRHWAAEALLHISNPSAEVAAAMADVALDLLGSGKKVDVPPAARIIAHVGAAPQGYKGRLREAFDRAEESVPKSVAPALRRLNLLRTKKGLGRLGR